MMFQVVNAIICKNTQIEVKFSTYHLLFKFLLDFSSSSDTLFSYNIISMYFKKWWKHPDCSTKSKKKGRLYTFFKINA